MLEQQLFLCIQTHLMYFYLQTKLTAGETFTCIAYFNLLVKSYRMVYNLLGVGPLFLGDVLSCNSTLETLQLEIGSPIQFIRIVFMKLLCTALKGIKFRPYIVCCVLPLKSLNIVPLVTSISIISMKFN